MLTQSNLIIDGGGTSSKGILLESGEIFSVGPGNILLNYNQALKNYKDLFTNISKKYSIKKVKMYVAGFASATTKMKMSFEKDILKFINLNELEIKSDSLLALDAYGEKSSSVTLGTGTSITTNINKNVDILYGLGHLIFEPMSGLGIMRRFITKIYNNKNKKEIDLTIKYLNFDSLQEFLKFIYDNPLDKKTIAKPFYEILNDDVLSPILKKVIDNEFLLFNSIEVKKVLEASKYIILNGSVAKNPYIANLFRQEYKTQEIYDENSFMDLAKRIEEKW